MNAAGIVGEIDAAGIWNPVLFAPKLEAMQMPVIPAHRDLEDVMSLGQGGVTPHQYAPADLRGDAQQMNLELVDRRQAVIADSGSNK